MPNTRVLVVAILVCCSGCAGFPSSTGSGYSVSDRKAYTADFLYVASSMIEADCSVMGGYLRYLNLNGRLTFGYVDGGNAGMTDFHVDGSGNRIWDDEERITISDEIDVDVGNMTDLVYYLKHEFGHAGAGVIGHPATDPSRTSPTYPSGLPATGYEYACY